MTALMTGSFTPRSRAQFRRDRIWTRSACPRCSAYRAETSFRHSGWACRLIGHAGFVSLSGGREQGRGVGTNLLTKGHKE
jgi:hypothetical protein